LLHHILSVCVLFFASLLCAAEIPDQDVRNANVPNTNTHFVFTPPAALEVWRQRRELLKHQILTAAGLDPVPDKAPLHPQIFGRIVRQGYTIEKVLVDTFPNYYLGGNLYRPSGAGRRPAVLLAHGHWPYGRLENEALCSPQALAASLARTGFVVFMYDMVGYDDTLQTPHHFGGDSERLWSFGPFGLQLWNSIRALDFVAALPDVDASQIGMTGPSGGATQTMMLTAVDERIRFAAPVNMVSAYMQGGDACENAPGLRAGTNNVEIAAMAAPRPMLIVSATGDWTKHVPVEEFPEIQKVYALYGKKDSVSVVQFDAPHNLNQQSRIAVERYFAKTILHTDDADSLGEQGIHTEALPDMLALFDKTLPAHAVTYSQLFEFWRHESDRQISTLNDTVRLRQLLEATLGVNWPADIVSRKTGGNRIALGRKGFGDRVPAYFEHRSRDAVLMLNPAGSEAAKKIAQSRQLTAKGQTLLAIDAFQTGEAVTPRDRSHPHFLTFNRGDDSNRVQDVLTALRFLVAQHCSTIDVYAEGSAAWWEEFAVAVAPNDILIRLHMPNQSLVDSEAAYLTNFNVPGILRVGGLRTADRLIKARNLK
jgi:dienelactone hydrolase